MSDEKFSPVPGYEQTLEIGDNSGIIRYSDTKYVLPKFRDANKRWVAKAFIAGREELVDVLKIREMQRHGKELEWRTLIYKGEVYDWLELSETGQLRNKETGTLYLTQAGSKSSGKTYAVRTGNDRRHFIVIQTALAYTFPDGEEWCTLIYGNEVYQTLELSIDGKLRWKDTRIELVASSFGDNDLHYRPKRGGINPSIYKQVAVLFTYPELETEEWRVAVYSGGIVYSELELSATGRLRYSMTKREIKLAGNTGDEYRAACYQPCLGGNQVRMQLEGLFAWTYPELEKEIFYRAKYTDGVDIGDYLEISKKGTIRDSVTRMVRKRLGEKLTVNDYTVTAYTDKHGRRHNISIHVIMGWTFIPRPHESFNIINHRDGCKNNFQLWNLEFCDVAYNTLHAYMSGLCEAWSSKRYPTKLTLDGYTNLIIKFPAEFERLSAADVTTIYEMYENRKMRITDIANRYKVSEQLINTIIIGSKPGSGKLLLEEYLELLKSHPTEFDGMNPLDAFNMRRMYERHNKSKESIMEKYSVSANALDAILEYRVFKESV